MSVRCCYLTRDRTICCRYPHRDFRGHRRQPLSPDYLHCCQQDRRRWQRETRKGNEKDIKFLMSCVLKAFDTEYIITAMNIGISVKWTIHVLNFCRILLVFPPTTGLCQEHQIHFPAFGRPWRLSIQALPSLDWNLDGGKTVRHYCVQQDGRKIISV